MRDILVYTILAGLIVALAVYLFDVDSSTGIFTGFARSIGSVGQTIGRMIQNIGF